jgi:hypothetical protein
MAKVILNTAEFLKVLSVGDVFWYMICDYCFVPNGIVGPCIVEKTKKDKKGMTMISFRVGKNGKKVERCLENITDCWHGVFLSRKDALKHLKVGKYAFANDPELIKMRKKLEAALTLTLEEFQSEMLSML